MKRVVILCCCLLLMIPVYAGLTLEECRRLAREHYPEIRQYDLIRQTAEFTVANARGLTCHSFPCRPRLRGRRMCRIFPIR